MIAISAPGAELARSIVSAITPEGSLRESNLPIDAFDPDGLSAWLLAVVGDEELAELVSDPALEREGTSLRVFVQQRFEQSVSVLTEACEPARG